MLFQGFALSKWTCCNKVFYTTLIRVRTPEIYRVYSFLYRSTKQWFNGSAWSDPWGVQSHGQGDLKWQSQRFPEVEAAGVFFNLTAWCRLCGVSQVWVGSFENGLHLFLKFPRSLLSFLLVRPLTVQEKLSPKIGFFCECTRVKPSCERIINYDEGATFKIYFLKH